MHAFLAPMLLAARGGRQPRHLALAVVVGCAAGAVCGWNLTFAALVLLGCLLNCRLWALPAAGACGLALASLGAPVTRAVGVFLLEKLELGALIASPDGGALWAMFALDDYRILGGLVTSLIAAVPTAHAVARFVAVRQTPDTEPGDPRQPAADSLLRTFGVPAACCCAAVTVGVIQTHGERLATETFLERASLALELNLSADKIEYGLWSGRLSITNLRVATVDEPERTTLLVEHVDAQTDPALFLRGRFSCSELQLAGVLCDSAARPQPRPGVFGGGPTLLKEGSAQTSHNIEPSRTVDVHDFVRSWSRLGERAVVLQQLVALVERVGDLESPSVAPAQLLTERRCLPRSSSLSRACPLVEIKLVKVDRLPTAWRFGPDTRLELSHLSSAPGAAEHFAQLSCRDAACALNLGMTFHLTGAERRHAVELSLEDVAADDVLTAGSMRGCFELGGARLAAVAGRGSVSRENVELNVCAGISNARIAPGAGPLAGLDAEIWRRSLVYLGEYRLDLKVAGRWNQLKLQCVPAAAVEQLKHQLRAAGAHELVQAVDKARSFAPGSTAVRPAAAAVAAYPTTATPHAGLPLLAAAVAPSSAPAAKTTDVATSTVAPATEAGKVSDTDKTAASPAAALTTLPASAVGPKTITPALLADAPTKPSSIVGALNKPLPTSAAAATTPALSTPAPSTSSTTTTSTAPAVAKTESNAAPTQSTTMPKPANVAETTVTGSKPAATEATKETSPLAVAANAPAKPAPLPNKLPTAVPPSRSNRPAIGVASDAAVAEVAAKPPVVRPIASPQLPPAALRQPLSVLDPSATPGPVNMSVGYTEERTESTSPATAPQQPPLYRGVPLPQGLRESEPGGPRLPSADLPATIDPPAVRTLPSQTAVPLPAGRPAVAESRRTSPAAEAAEAAPVRVPEAGRYPRIPDHVDSVAPAEAEKPARRGFLLPEFGNYGNKGIPQQPRLDADGKPVRSKGLLGGLNLFGGKKEEEPIGESIELTPPVREPMETEPAPQDTKPFPRLRALFSFGSADVEIEEPSDGAANVDYEATPPAGTRRAVQPSSYAADAEAQESVDVRRAAPAAEPVLMTADEPFYGRLIR